MRFTSGVSGPGIRATHPRDPKTVRSLLLAVFLASSTACSEDLKLAPPSTHPSASATAPAAPPDGGGSITATTPRTGEAMGSREGAPDGRTVATRLRKSMRPKLAEWRRSLNEIARVSPRGERAVALRRIVLAAIEAESDEEYHRILRQLPRRSGQIASSNGASEGGPADVADRSGFVGAFVMNVAYARGGVRASRLARTAESSVSGPSAGLAEMSFSDQCTTVWEGVEYVDECATQAEIDEGVAVLDAIEVELKADYAEAQALCWEIFGPNDLVCSPESASNATTRHEYAQGHIDDAAPSFVLANNPSLGGVRIVSVSLPLAEESNCGPVGIATAFRASEAADDCWVGGLAAAVGVFNYVGAWFQAKDIMLRGASRSGHFFMYGALMTGSFATGYGISTWLQCLHERRMQGSKDAPPPADKRDDPTSQP